MSKPKIILFDLETAPIQTATFSLYPTSIHHTSILKDWSIICICWKELGKKKIHSVSVLDDPERFKKDPLDDKYVVEKFREILLTADAISGHNLSKFDIKKFTTRLVYHKLPPVPKIPELDTLKLWKRIASATSNRLDYLGTFFGVGGKLPTTPGLWMRCLNGEKSAIREMVRYCKVDVEKLEEVYLRMRPYLTNHPHLGAMAGEDRHESCPNCGGTNLVISKTRYTAAGLPRIQKQCKDCHHYSTHLK